MTKKIILASISPRRKKLLGTIIPEADFSVLGSAIQERILPDENAESYSIRISEAKARDVIKRYKKKIGGKAIVLGADTVISFNNKIIGKPKDVNEARRILKKISGKSHEVITGVAIVMVDGRAPVKFIASSKVWMKNLSDETIEEYVKSGEPMGKAGAYAIQGLGKNLIERFEGSYTNIIGLPVDELRKALTPLLKDCRTRLSSRLRRAQSSRTDGSYGTRG